MRNTALISPKSSSATLLAAKTAIGIIRQPIFYYEELKLQTT